MYLLAILIDNRKLRLAWRRADRQRIVGIAQNRSTPAGEDSSAQCARHEKRLLDHHSPRNRIKKRSVLGQASLASMSEIRDPEWQ